jgi:hypothetical protein
MKTRANEAASTDRVGTGAPPVHVERGSAVACFQNKSFFASYVFRGYEREEASRREVT